MNEEWIKTLRFPSYYLKAVHSEKYNRVTPFLYAALIPLNYHAHIFVCKKQVLYLRNMVGNASSVKQLLQSALFNGEDTVNEM